MAEQNQMTGPPDNASYEDRVKFYMGQMGAPTNLPIPPKPPESGGGGALTGLLGAGLLGFGGYKLYQNLIAKKAAETAVASAAPGAAAGAIPATPSILSASALPQSPTLLGASAIPGTTGAAAATAPTGLLTGASPALYFGAPLAGLAAFSALAPSIAKGGQKIGNFLGISDDKPERVYKPQEAIQSKRIGGQLSGFDQLNDAQKQVITDQAQAMGMLRLPGYADKEGNTVKGIGQEFIKPRWMNADYIQKYINQHGPGSAWGISTRPLSSFELPGNIQNYARSNWEQLLGMIKPEGPAPTLTASPFAFQNRTGATINPSDVLPMVAQNVSAPQVLNALAPQKLDTSPQAMEALKNIVSASPRPIPRGISKKK